MREFPVRKGVGLESVFAVFCLLLLFLLLLLLLPVFFFFFFFGGALRPQEIIRLIRDRGAQDGHLDFLTALEL